MKLTKLEKEYCRIHNWTKRKGTMITNTSVMTDSDSFFVADECKDDYFERTSQWTDDEGNDEGCYDDDEIIGHIEDYAQISFEDFKKSQEKK